MKIDSVGNLYCTGPLGVWIVSPAGILIDTILLPNNESASNCNWGDADRKSLFITSGSGASRSLYRIRLAPPTGVKRHGYLQNGSFELYSNYPNPFNPSTTISYQVPSTAYTSLKIFDTLGREIATLVNGIKAAGFYTVNYNASNLTSGIYFCQLKCGSFSQTKKMVLAK